MRIPVPLSGHRVYKGSQGHLSYTMMDMFCILIEGVCTFVRTCWDSILKSVCFGVHKLYLSKSRAVHFCQLKLLHFAFILSNLRKMVEKFEPAVKDGSSHHEAWERGCPWALVLLSFLPSQALWSPSRTCPTEGCSLSVGTLNHSVIYASLSLPLLPLRECLEGIIFLLPFLPRAQCLHYQILCLHD